MTSNGVGTCGADDNQAQAGHLIPTTVMGGVTHTLTSEGADASEDGTGRGTPIVAYAPDVTTGGGKPGQGYPAVLSIDMRNAVRSTETGQSAGTGIGEEGAPSYTLSATKRALPAVGYDTVVRRLTELECERLQGYPDGWTERQSGSARYRQLGNSLAVPVVEWIARRLIAVDAEVKPVTCLLCGCADTEHTAGGPCGVRVWLKPPTDVLPEGWTEPCGCLGFEPAEDEEMSA